MWRERGEESEERKEEGNRRGKGNRDRHLNTRVYEGGKGGEHWTWIHNESESTGGYRKEREPMWVSVYLWQRGM